MPCKISNRLIIILILVQDEFSFANSKEGKNKTVADIKISLSKVYLPVLSA